jgi:hypothetical protein
MTLTRDDKLIILIEECGEVIKAATKCLRFGWDRISPTYGINHLVLAEEIGDLFGMVDSLDLDRSIIESHRANKIAKATNAKLKFGRRE